ncbi:stromal cell-derived factor 1 isoform X5 [Hippopotamus amphibius kiboko]|uniref:stromal cell-derived factor 1 isoform X5 n=1 Tax=Hippopotamus amphibius kiboko TaxID=575201 RepID=UPI002594600A|nr:stromal cell-derived factor 1 isoform X5 [Hippopotamus amphibius kiboko]
MNAKFVFVLGLVLTALCLSDEKPVSLSYRCPCRFFESHVARANVKHLKILNTPNCALQIVPSSTLLGLTSALGTSPASTTVGITSRS